MRVRSSPVAEESATCRGSLRESNRFPFHVGHNVRVSRLVWSTPSVASLLSTRDMAIRASRRHPLYACNPPVCRGPRVSATLPHPFLFFPLCSSFHTANKISLLASSFSRVSSRAHTRASRDRHSILLLSRAVFEVGAIRGSCASILYYIVVVCIWMIFVSICLGLWITCCCFFFFFLKGISLRKCRLYLFLWFLFNIGFFSW